VWARSRKFSGVGVFIILAFMPIWAILLQSTRSKTTHNQQVYVCMESYRQDSLIQLNDQTFSTQEAKTITQQEKGLSGRACLGELQAMYFPIEPQTFACFWMKDMRFSIDIVWFDKDNAIIYLQKNASPDSYPQQFCTEKPTKYVLELPAGTVDKLGLTIGDLATKKQ
jgi:uncharacterized membrane protein (UPF0127 family)